MRTFVDKLLTPLGMDVNQMNGFWDFIIGFILIIMPWFYVQEGNIQSLAIVMTVGSALILYSIFTDYKYGIIRFLAKKIHEVLLLTIGITIMALWPTKVSITNFFIAFAGFGILIVCVLL